MIIKLVKNGETRRNRIIMHQKIDKIVDKTHISKQKPREENMRVACRKVEYAKLILISINNSSQRSKESHTNNESENSKIHQKIDIASGCIQQDQCKDPSNEDYIYFNDQTKTILIKSPSDLARYLLPIHFNHNNYSSFVRQLNLYKFQKRKNENPLVHEYHHPNFDKNDPNKLMLLRRGPMAKKGQEEQKNEQLQNQQNRKMVNTEQKLKQDNQAHIKGNKKIDEFEEKYKNQQILKVISFFINLLRTNTNLSIEQIQALHDNLKDEQKRQMILQSDKVKKQFFISVPAKSNEGIILNNHRQDKALDRHQSIISENKRIIDDFDKYMDGCKRRDDFEDDDNGYEGGKNYFSF